MKHTSSFLSVAVVMVSAVLALLAGGTGQVLAANFYVGGDGASDRNPGTAAQPFATIQKAAGVAAAGELASTVLVFPSRASWNNFQVLAWSTSAAFASSGARLLCSAREAVSADRATVLSRICEYVPFIYTPQPLAAVRRIARMNTVRVRFMTAVLSGL